MQTEKKHKPFSPTLFIITIIVLLVIILWLFAFFEPAIWHVQLRLAWWIYLPVFVGMNFFTCFIEYFFHRYVLHAHIIPGFRSFFVAHTRHHALTKIHVREPTSGNNLREPVVENKYLIDEDEQHKHSFFPFWSLVGFSFFATPFFALFQSQLPELPIFLVGYVTLAWGLIFYELLHAAQHKPYETWWKSKIENPIWGWYWNILYRTHIAHHANIYNSEGISGFFGIPLADWIFGTLKMPRTLYEDGTAAYSKDFESPIPRWPIQQLDKFADWIKRKRVGI